MNFLNVAENAIWTLSRNFSAADHSVGWRLSDVPRGEWTDSSAVAFRRDFFRGAPVYGKQDCLKIYRGWRAGANRPRQRQPRLVSMGRSALQQGESEN